MVENEISDFANKQELVDKSITQVSVALRSFGKKPFKNGSVQLIAILFFFLNSLAVENLLDLLTSVELEVSIGMKNLNPWYSIIWFLVIASIFAYAVNEKIKVLTGNIIYTVSSKSPIKGLFAFDFRDADVFNNLERMDEIQSNIFKELNHILTRRS